MKKLLLTALLILLALPAFAKDYTVKMVTDDDIEDSYRFDPDKLTIQPGDTVNFVNDQNDKHDVVFESVPKAAEFAKSPMLRKKGQSWSYTFTHPGTYKYHCHPHAHWGMRGVIIVGKPSKPEDMKTDASHHHDHGDHDMAGMDHDHEDGDMHHESMEGMHHDHGHEGMEDMHGSHDMDHMAMKGFYGSYAMTREASGTAWVPESSPMEGVHDMIGPWMLMAHGYADLVYDHQGGKRGANKTFSESMGMIMANRPMGPGTFGLRGMFSLDPAMGKGGYPLLLQTGETADGVTHLIDRQHPHDLLMELAATYSLPLTDESSVFVYLGYPGEPALGPATFMHRFSGVDNPEAPISHHWLDSTHITFGVVTAGYVWRNWKVEGSVFTGREPDQFRWNFDRPRFDSWSGRITYNPTENWSLQMSRGHIESPEQLEPNVNQTRTTASAIYNLPMGEDNWQTTLAWGRNENSPGKTLNAILLESAFRFNKQHAVFGRAEYAEKDELFEAPSPLAGTQFDVGKFSLGYVYDIPVFEHVAWGLGGVASVYALPGSLDASYGSSPFSYMLFTRLKLVGGDHE
ncbi:MAG: cupredoxin domain-containing protein [Proteobacteria bacterium]|nr:cupredoxin domain-containing protein [Pseudomonadota bacterium]